MPPPPFARRHPKRFMFHRLDVEASYACLEKAFAPLADLGIKIVLSVSPVPIERTFTPADCVTANEYSKAVLRVCAEMLEKRFGNVDYFPSYEIAKSGGIANFIDDNVHVKDEVVHRIVAYMIEQYRRATPAPALPREDRPLVPGDRREHPLGQRAIGRAADDDVAQANRRGEAEARRRHRKFDELQAQVAEPA